MDGLHIFLIVTSVVSLVAAASFGWACFNMIKKIETYEEWVAHFRAEVENVYTRLKTVDDKNLFDKDDDVGFVFSEIVRITKEFDETVK